MEQETTYLRMLQKTSTFSYTENQLVIYTTAGELIYGTNASVPPIDPTVMLVDRTWYLTEINGALPVPGAQINVLFASDNSISGSTGCNLFSARYFIDGWGLTISPIAKTENLCEDLTAVQETAFLDIIQSAIEYEVNAKNLKILSYNGELVFTYRPPEVGEP